MCNNLFFYLFETYFWLAILHHFADYCHYDELTHVHFYIVSIYTSEDELLFLSIRSNVLLSLFISLFDKLLELFTIFRVDVLEEDGIINFHGEDKLEDLEEKCYRFSTSLHLRFKHILYHYAFLKAFYYFLHCSSIGVVI